MCYGCYEEEDKPTIINEKTLAAAAAVKKIYGYNPVGSNLHIVTDDWNLEDDNVEFCLKQIQTENFWKLTPEELLHEEATAKLLLSMSVPERASALALWEGWIEP